jgi:aminopeptidase N
VFRALVYNKGAAVLHMLRRFLGDDSFFNGLKRFYSEQKFRKTGTEDLRLAFERESGRPLERFFERWVYGAAIARVRYATTVGVDSVTVLLEQPGDVFDLPVTVTVVYADGKREDHLVLLTESRVEHTVPTNRRVRQVQVNGDYAAVAEFERN